MILNNNEYEFLGRLIKSFNDFSYDMFDSWPPEDKDKAMKLLIKIRNFLKEYETKPE